MKITTQIQTTDPNYPYSPEQAASQVLAALGGNPANDTSTATVRKLATLITVNVTLEDDDNMPYTAEQAADQAMAALAGNPTKDTCELSMVMPAASGHAGV